MNIPEIRSDAEWYARQHAKKLVEAIPPDLRQTVTELMVLASIATALDILKDDVERDNHRYAYDPESELAATRDEGEAYMRGVLDTLEIVQ